MNREPHRYESGVGHMTAPEDVISCCQFGPAHEIHIVTPEMEKAEKKERQRREKEWAKHEARRRSRGRILEFKNRVVNAWCADSEMTNLEYAAALSELTADIVKKLQREERG